MARPLLCTCGAPLSAAASHCFKCDRPVALGRQGVIEVDVAHDGQRTAEAVQQAEDALAEATRTLAAGVRIVHGRGERISMAIQGRIRSWIADGRVARQHPVSGNPGATMVWLGPSSPRVGIKAIRRKPGT